MKIEIEEADYERLVTLKTLLKVEESKAIHMAFSLLLFKHQLAGEGKHLAIYDPVNHKLSDIKYR